MTGRPETLEQRQKRDAMEGMLRSAARYEAMAFRYPEGDRRRDYGLQEALERFDLAARMERELQP